jgi:hypothetical protein
MGLLTLSFGVLALWVRSCWWSDNVIGPPSGPVRYGMASGNGWLTYRFRNGKLTPQSFPKWTWRSTSAAAMEKVYKQMEDSIKGTPGATFARPTFAFGWKDDWGFQFPHWIPIAITTIFAIALKPKPRLKFSLADLLVLMTFPAVLIAGVAGLSRLAS